MKIENKNILIGAGVVIVGYYFYNKQLQTKPYSESELDKVVTENINDLVKNLKSSMQNTKPDVEKAKKTFLDMIKSASLNGKDVSRANINKILKLLSKRERNAMGDNSVGILTVEEINILDDFRGFKPRVSQVVSSPIGEKKDLGNGLSVVYDIANCNTTTKKCPIIKVIKVQGDNVTSWYKENNKYFKRIESPLTPKNNAIEISEKQWIEQAISITPE
jgi:hypothetical protein